jgi:hypothetical protein
MLNAKLRPGVNLLHVMAMTRALGEQLSAKEATAGDLPLDRRHRLHVTCEFAAASW